MILSSLDIKKVIEEEWPKENKNYANMILDKKASYKFYFLNSIMKKINGRANQNEVLELIIEFAKGKL